MSRLLLVRHGITEFNSSRRYAGHRDVGLSLVGYQQAERLRGRLVDDKIDAVYSSDLKRALVTAEVILSGRKGDIVTCPELREVDYGNVEGLTFEEMSRLYPEVAESFVNPSLRLEYPDGESLKELAKRVGKFPDKLKGSTPSQTTLIVSHRGPLRVLICCLLGMDLKHWRQRSLDNASLSIVETYPQGAILSRLNDTAHLRGVGESD